MNLRYIALLVLASWTTPALADDDKDSLQSAVTTEFFRYNKFQEPGLSPDGKLVAVFESFGEIRELVVIDPINRRKFRILRDEAGLELDGVWWVDNEHFIFTYVSYRQDRMGLGTMIFDGELPVDVSTAVLGNDWYMVDPMQNIKDKAVILVRRKDLWSLYPIDVNDPEATVNHRRDIKFQSKINRTDDWLLDATGRVRVAVGTDDEKQLKTLWYRTRGSNSWRVAWEGDPEIIIVPVLAHDDDRTITVLSNEFSDNTILTTYDRRDKTYGDTIFAVDGYDIESVLVDAEKTHVIRARTIEQGFEEHYYIGEQYAAMAASLEAHSEAAAPYVIDFSLNKRRAIIQTSTNDDPGAFFLFDIDDNSSFRFGTLRPWLSKFRLGKSQLINITTDDGLTIESYLTLPDKAVYEKPPLIVMPHGGPISVRDTLHFDSTVQLLSTLGYAVLQTNYRGSGGLGKSFEEQGQQQWGRSIEDDIEASLRAVIDLDVVDSDKMCIYGASYGGYSALISAIRNLVGYKCAASFAGVTDMTLLFHAFSANHSNIIRAAWERIVGDPSEDLESLIEFSPVYNVDKIQIPVFLAHGMEDETVLIEHYYRMKKMLEYFDKDAEYLVFRNEAHGFRHAYSRTRFYEKLDRFFRRSMGLDEPSLDSVLRDAATWPEYTDPVPAE